MESDRVGPGPGGRRRLTEPTTGGARPALGEREWRIGSNTPALFRFEGVTVDGSGGRRLDGATGEVPDRGVTVVAGPSGAGKSTLLRCCNRLERPTSGRVELRGVDVTTLDPLRLRRRVGMVFQRPTPFPGSVLENLRVAAPSLTEDEAGAALRDVGLDPSFTSRVATELSGGEAQRVCLARTLVTEPEVVLLDEVTSSVDPAARRGLEELARVLASRGVAVLWVTHDLAQLRRLADHVIVLVAGRVAYDGPAARLDVDAPPEVARFLAAVAVDGEGSAS